MIHRYATPSSPTVTRRTVLTGLAGAATFTLAGCIARARPGAEVTVEEGFEDGLDGWKSVGRVGHDAADEFKWCIERSSNRSHDGDYSLAVFTEGDHDDGTAWMTREIPVTPGRAYDATVSVRAWSASASFNTVRHLVAFLAPAAPETENDLPAPGENSTDRSGLTAGGLREPLDLQAVGASTASRGKRPNWGPTRCSSLSASASSGRPTARTILTTCACDLPRARTWSTSPSNSAWAERSREPLFVLGPELG